MKYDFTSLMNRSGHDSIAVDQIPIPGAEVKEGFSGHGEQQAQQGRQPVERAVGAGQSRADEDEDHGVAQTIRPHGQYPGGKGVGFHRRGFISAGMVFSG